MIWLLLPLLLFVILALSYRLASRSSAPLSEQSPWAKPLVFLGDLLIDLRVWWFGTCPDCRKNFGDSQGLTAHLCSREGCTVPPLF